MRFTIAQVGVHGGNYFSTDQLMGESCIIPPVKTDMTEVKSIQHYSIILIRK